MKEKLNKEFLDLRRFENPINSIDLIKSITSNPNIENDPFYIVDLRHMQQAYQLDHQTTTC